ncbi:MAG: selenocysteine-specific translation elongation factor [Bacillota bacterium]
MDWFIIGTAGHVDHGKTQLVKALTGQDTDRLKEEKERGISIELGFASLKLPNGKNAAIIDVPGHERFIKQMLAGVTGIDMVMLVIAADEGVMPQTREHLDIINLLQVKKGLTVITKVDLVDEEWLELVQEDVKDFVKGTILEGDPIVKVSALTNLGMDELKTEIVKISNVDEAQRGREGQLRLPVDRSFTLAGFGTVVTGTLWFGDVKVGDTVEVQPVGKKTRVRGIQVHGEARQSAHAGQRVALNLSDVEVEEVPRGSSIVHIGAFSPSHKLDAKLMLLKSVAKSLKHRQRVRVHLGTSEKLARVNLLDREELLPGDETYVQLQMEDPLIGQRGDRFVIRSYSPMHTIGGGVILEPYGTKIKRYSDAEIEILEVKEQGNPEQLIEHLLQKSADKFISLNEIANQLNLPREQVAPLVKNAADVYLFEGEGLSIAASKRSMEKWLARILQELKKFHEKYPLREGMDREEVRSRFFPKLSIKEFNLLIGRWQNEGKIVLKNAYLQLPGFTHNIGGPMAEALEKAERAFLNKDFQPPAWEEVSQNLKVNTGEKEEILRFLINQGKLIKVADGLYFHKDSIEKAKSLIIKAFSDKEFMVLSDIRDLLNSSRKYVLPLLEYLDSQKFTKRVEDKRYLAKR